MRPMLILCLAGVTLAGAIVPIAAQDKPAAAARSIELILDASGSMMAKLPDGQLKIDAARTAVENFLAAVPSGSRLAFRAYGHQSPREKHDCGDTALLIPFGDAAAASADVVAKSRALKAQGYTPITTVLGLAAKDFASGAGGDRVIVLVSDGKETCDGDPCATARALQASGAGVVIHTIGFDVDKASRAQLECIARATRGTYFDALNADQLAAVIAKAAVQTATRMQIETTGPGWLQVKGAELSGHDVADAATGKVVATLSNTQSTIQVPSGLYNVKFGQAWWKSVDVKAGKTTVLEPGILHVKGASFQGHHVLDGETGIDHAGVSSMHEYATLMPGTYDVTFGPLVWSGVRLEGGQTKELVPGSLTVHGVDIHGVPVKSADGRAAGSVSQSASTLVLPPGEYQVLIGAKWQPFALRAGQHLTLDVK